MTAISYVGCSYLFGTFAGGEGRLRGRGNHMIVNILVQSTASNQYQYLSYAIQDIENRTFHRTTTCHTWVISLAHSNHAAPLSLPALFFRNRPPIYQNLTPNPAGHRCLTFTIQLSIELSQEEASISVQLTDSRLGLIFRALRRFVQGPRVLHCTIEITYINKLKEKSSQTIWNRLKVVLQINKKNWDDK